MDHPVALTLPKVAIDRGTAFFGFVLLANLVLLGVYEFSTFKSDLHSDSAVKVLLAEEILRSGELFPTGWVYANGDVYAFSPHTFALPFVPIFGAGFTTHALAGMLVGLLLLLATAALLRELGFPRWQQLAMLAFVASGVSSLLAETLYGQATYGFIIMMNVTVLASGLAFLRRFGTSARLPWGHLALFSLASFLSAVNNPKRAAAMLTIPFLVACGVQVLRAVPGRLPRPSEVLRAPQLFLAAAHLGAIAAAAFGARQAAQHVRSVDIVALATWLGPDGTWRNFLYAVLGVLAHLSGIPPAGGIVSTVWGAYDVFRMLIAVPVAWAAVKAVRTVMASPDGPGGFVATFATTSGALSLLMFVFTTLPDAGSPFPSARYLIPAFFVALMLIPVLFPARPMEGPWRPRLLAGCVTAIACCGVTSLALPGYGGNGGRWRDAAKRGQERLELIELLERQGLRYGYSTYWTAGALTLLSEGRLKVRPMVTDAVPTPMRVHAAGRWFTKDEWSGETFLLLTETEAKQVDRPLVDVQLGAPTRTLSYREFKIWIYPNNPATLPNWVDLAAGPQRFPVSARSLHHVGAFDEQQGPPRVHAGTHEAGNLLFGPYLTLGMGHYKVAFDVAAEGAPDASVGSLQVTARQGNVELGNAQLLPGPRAQRQLEFDVFSEAKAVELRVVTNGAGEVSVFGTALERVNTGP